MLRNISILAALVFAAPLIVPATRAEQASPPQGTSIAVYDTGFGLVNETRRLNLAKGDNEIVARQIPSRIDPSTAALGLMAGGRGLELSELRYENDLSTDEGLFTRYLGRPVSVSVTGGDVEGTLLSVPKAGDGLASSTPLAIQGADGAKTFYDLNQVRAVNFPRADQSAFLEPTLLWGARAEQEGLQNVRLTYMTEGFSWWAYHEIVLAPDGQHAHVSSRVALRNETGGRFVDARVKLVATDKGSAGENSESPAAQRYAYGRPDALAASSVAALNAVGTYDLPQQVSIQDGQTRYYTFVEADNVAVTRFYVYDGVRFDRFQRNRQNDWNYGTEYGKAVDSYIEFTMPATTAGGNLPAGTVRLYDQRADGSLDYQGRDVLRAMSPKTANTAKLGPARGLLGERVRTGYNEIRPQHEYEETFEIRLSNLSDEAVQIRVVEHLYRSADFDVVKSDVEYVSTEAQTIEFRPDLKPGGKRTIHYTVRYRW